MRSEGHKYHIFSTQGLMAQNLGGMTNILCRVVAWAWLWLLFSLHHCHWRTSFIVFVAHPKSSGDLRLWKWFLKHLAWISCQWYNLVTSASPQNLVTESPVQCSAQFGDSWPESEPALLQHCVPAIGFLQTLSRQKYFLGFPATSFKCLGHCQLRKQPLNIKMFILYFQFLKI